MQKRKSPEWIQLQPLCGSVNKINRDNILLLILVPHCRMVDVRYRSGVLLRTGCDHLVGRRFLVVLVVYGTDREHSEASAESACSRRVQVAWLPERQARLLI
jgi:hypothetical protein